jgi:hypothetical protein
MLKGVTYSFTPCKTINKIAKAIVIAKQIKVFWGIQPNKR